MLDNIKAFYKDNAFFCTSFEILLKVSRIQEEIDNFFVYVLIADIIL